MNFLNCCLVNWSWGNRTITYKIILSFTRGRWPNGYEVFDVSLDYLIGVGSNSKFDKKTLQRLQDIEELDQSTKDKMFFFIDTVIRDYKARQAYANT